MKLQQYLVSESSADGGKNCSQQMVQCPKGTTAAEVESWVMDNLPAFGLNFDEPIEAKNFDAFYAETKIRLEVEDCGFGNKRSDYHQMQ